MKVLCNIGLLASLTLALGACASVNIPDADLLKFSEAHEGAKDLKTFPEITQAPQVPTDLRSDADWDEAARNLQNIRDGFRVPSDLEPAKTEAELERELQAARAKVHAYKKDDPQ